MNWVHNRRHERDMNLRESEILRLRAKVDELRREVDTLNVYRQMAYHDDLTGLRNRRYFEERLREEIQRSERAGLPCSVISIDVDDFKRVNDVFGHVEGDTVLKEIGQLLTTHSRVVDIPCRVGGDEFAVILPLTGPEGARTIRARLDAAQVSLSLPDGSPVTLSLGLATYPDEEMSVRDLLQHADRAMYSEKKKRKEGSSRGNQVA